VAINIGEFCFGNKKGIPNIYKIMETIPKSMETERLYLIMSVTTGGFTKVKNPTVSLDFLALIPIPKNNTATRLQIIKAIIIFYSSVIFRLSLLII